MLPVILGMLTSPKFIAAGAGLLAQLIGHFGFGVDQQQLTVAISPLYLYVLAQAHAESGHTEATAAVTPGAPATVAAAAPASKAVAS